MEQSLARFRLVLIYPFVHLGAEEKSKRKAPEKSARPDHLLFDELVEEQRLSHLRIGGKERAFPLALEVGGSRCFLTEATLVRCTHQVGLLVFCVASREEISLQDFLNIVNVLRK